MKKYLLGAAALAAAALSSPPALAGIYADDATRCLAKSMTEADQIALVKWIFVAMAQHPALKEYSQVTPAQRTQSDKDMSALVTKLLMQTCRKEAVDAIKYEGPGFLEKSFGALGEIAVGGLMTNPDVAKGLATWATPEDIQAFGALAAEAGRPTPPKP
jgi:hypothetical protein